MYFIATRQLGLEPESARKDKLQTRSAYEPEGPIKPGCISGFISMKRPGVFATPPWIGCYSIAGLSPAIRRYPFIHLSRGRHRESKVSCPRTQHNVPSQDLNPDHSIRSRALQP